MTVGSDGRGGRPLWEGSPRGEGGEKCAAEQGDSGPERAGEGPKPGGGARARGQDRAARSGPYME